MLVRKIVLITLAVIFFSYATSTLYMLYRYYSLNQTTQAVKLDWKIKQTKPDSYHYFVNYSYVVNGKNYSSSQLIQKPRFLNRISAENELKDYQHRKWQVWYSHKQHTDSSLQKQFPLKQCIYSLILLGLLLYFSGLFWLYQFDER